MSRTPGNPPAPVNSAEKSVTRLNALVLQSRFYVELLSAPVEQRLVLDPELR